MKSKNTAKNDYFHGNCFNTCLEATNKRLNLNEIVFIQFLYLPNTE